MDIQLNFINQSNDQNNSQIVIFQKNVATNFEEIAVAWKVIQHTPIGWHHKFAYPEASYIAVTDSWGNTSPLYLAENGQRFSVSLNASGETLQLDSNSSSATEIELLNALQTGAIHASIYKDGKPLLTSTNIAPGQKAVFEFKPTIFIGVVSEIEEGQVMNSAIISQINTEISLFGIASADIVMTGGGPGASSTSFQFNLENIVMA
jgi:hypothetical protein